MKAMFLNTDVPAYGALVRAGICKALDPSCKTPAPILMAGDHWPAAVASALPRGPRCLDHPTFDAANCRCCWSEIKTGMRPEVALGTRLALVPPVTDGTHADTHGQPDGTADRSTGPSRAGEGA